MKKVLLHTCCAPCATYINRWLGEHECAVTAYYYNPNIYPEHEFVKRYAVLKHYAAKIGLPLVFDFDNLKLSPGDCESCYLVRLGKTASYARSNGFEAFTSTLLISPYQDHALIRSVGEQVALDVGIEFVYHDFRDGYKESRIISREFGLYMQKYCGCEKSFLERRTVKNEQAAPVAY